MKTSPVMLLCALLGSCADNLQVPDTNVTPVAVARALADNPTNPVYTFTGRPVSVTLDASQSHDPDGSIRSYRWLSATTAGRLGVEADDAGAAMSGKPESDRWLPPGAPADWPEDVLQPQLSLPDVGDYAFTLWVIDDRGRISEPSTIRVRISRAP